MDPSIDLFLGHTGSLLLFRSCELYRNTALGVQEAIDLLDTYPRPPRFPGRQKLHALILSGCSAANPRDLLSEDLALHVGGLPGAVPGQQMGYDMRIINTWRLCLHVVSADCIMRNSSDACVAMHKDDPLPQYVTPGDSSALAGDASGTTGAPLYSAHSISPGTAIVIAAAVSGTVSLITTLAVMGAAACWHKRRMQRMRTRGVQTLLLLEQVQQGGMEQGENGTLPTIYDLDDEGEEGDGEGEGEFFKGPLEGPPQQQPQEVARQRHWPLGSALLGAFSFEGIRHATPQRAAPQAAPPLVQPAAQHRQWLGSALLGSFPLQRNVVCTQVQFEARHQPANVDQVWL